MRSRYLGSAPFCFGEVWKQHRKAWGTYAAEKGMFSLGEGARNLEDVRPEEDEAVRKSDANERAWGQWRWKRVMREKRGKVRSKVGNWKI